MKAKLLWIILGISTAFAAGVDAYREGRFRDAVTAFRSAATEAGEESVAVQMNLAIAAARAGDWSTAKIAAEKVAAFDGGRGEAFRADICAFVEYRRADLLEAIADMPGSAPEAFDDAIRAVETARDMWQDSIRRDAERLGAKRNVERALLRIEDLRTKKAEAEKRDDRKRREKKPNPVKDPKRRPDETNERKRDPRGEKPFVIRSTDLSDDQVKKLMDRLDAKNDEKSALRRARLGESGATVEKDW